MTATTDEAAKAESEAAKAESGAPTQVEAPPESDSESHTAAHLKTPRRLFRRSGTPTAGARRRQQQRLLVVALVLLIITSVGLVLAALDLVWTSTAGHYVQTGRQAHEPDYLALVDPSPTMLVASVHDDELVGVAVLALHPRDEGGAVIVLPAGTRVADLTEDGGGARSTLPRDEVDTLADLYDDDGGEGVAEGIEQLFRVAIADTVEVGEAAWASLVKPVEPLDLFIPDAVGDRWRPGEVDLAGDEVAEFLRAQGDEESELNRLTRQELFWRAWLAAVAAGGESAVPGESDREGLSRFVDGLRRDRASVSSLPLVVRGSPGDDGGEYFEADAEDVAAIVASEIPYPQEPETGARTRVSLLNGTSETDLALRVSGPLVGAGAEIAVTGNAASFDEPRTLLIYSDADQRQAAAALRQALGVGELEHRAQAVPSVVDDRERIDVTVILGADAPEAIRRSQTTD